MIVDKKTLAVTLASALGIAIPAGVRAQTIVGRAAAGSASAATVAGGLTLSGAAPAPTISASLAVAPSLAMPALAPAAASPAAAIPLVAALPVAAPVSPVAMAARVLPAASAGRVPVSPLAAANLAAQGGEAASGAMFDGSRHGAPLSESLAAASARPAASLSPAKAKQSPLVEEPADAPPSWASRIDHFADEHKNDPVPAPRRLTLAEKIMAYFGVRKPEPAPVVRVNDNERFVPGGTPFYKKADYVNLFYVRPGATIRFEKSVSGRDTNLSGRWAGYSVLSFAQPWHQAYGHSFDYEVEGVSVFNLMLPSGRTLKRGDTLTVSRWPRVLFDRLDVFIEIPVRLKDGTRGFLVAVASKGDQQRLSVYGFNTALHGVAAIRP
jgi:hypothetical protein